MTIQKDDDSLVIRQLAEETKKRRQYLSIKWNLSIIPIGLLLIRERILGPCQLVDAIHLQNRMIMQHHF